MKKKSTLLKKCLIVSTIALMLVQFILPRQSEFEADMADGIAVCVIENDEDIRRPLDGTDFD